jgi:DNA-binding transcriptional ArsR family regulator
LWQSLVLTQLHPLFAHLPVENIVFQYQQEYYEAINQSTGAADCAPFVEFMLEKILDTLRKRQGEPLSKENDVGVNVGVNVGVKTISENILIMVEQKPGINANQIAASIPDKTKRTIERQLAKLKEAGAIEFKGADKTGGYFIKSKE